MNEKEILQWLDQAASHALMAYRNSGRAEKHGEHTAFKEAAAHIRATLKMRREANIAALDRKQVP